jgi:hypothetical protein
LLALGGGSLVLLTGESADANMRTAIASDRGAARRRHGEVSVVRFERAHVQDIATRIAEARVREAVLSLRRHLMELLKNSANEHAALAVQDAAALSDEEGQLEALRDSLPRWLAQDREAARVWLLDHVATLPPSVALALLRDTAAFDPELSLSLARRLTPAARIPALREIFSAWAENAPEQAAHAAAELVESEGQARVVGEVARVWAEQAPAEAQTWASALTTPEARREALIPIVDSWAVQDAKQAAAALARVPEDEGYKQRLVDTVAAAWVRESPLAARAWVETLAPALHEGAAMALLDSLLQSDAQRAANWALELGGGDQSPVVEKTLTSWVARDAGAALTWVIKLPERHGRTALLVLATDRFRLQDGPGAERWLTVHGQTGSAP